MKDNCSKIGCDKKCQTMFGGRVEKLLCDKHMSEYVQECLFMFNDFIRKTDKK